MLRSAWRRERDDVAIDAVKDIRRRWAEYSRTFRISSFSGAHGHRAVCRGVSSVSSSSSRLSMAYSAIKEAGEMASMKIYRMKYHVIEES